MPRETRSLFFSPHEIVAAVADFHLRRKMPIPKGKIVSMSFSAPPDIEATFQILAEGETVPARFVLKGETLAAALVFYCINRSIPMPALSRKQLRKADDGLELVISNMRAH
ncbi:hypothetical protein L2U69_17680 [Zavarzinia compransoris]|uniref:hypothetical protein n=1 Tax=Zavarzinia marina TaxID=2911065 RepID=UPI001F291CA1|nr:hypothetical protein [Zavarzinia marina]MCF4167482.1 hypothetical protein [Zavarzinia marina]